MAALAVEEGAGPPCQVVGPGGTSDHTSSALLFGCPLMLGRLWFSLHSNALILFVSLITRCICIVPQRPNPYPYPAIFPYPHIPLHIWGPYLTKNKYSRARRSGSACLCVCTAFSAFLFSAQPIVALISDIYLALGRVSIACGFVHFGVCTFWIRCSVSCAEQ